MLEKAAIIKIIEYLPLDSELRKQTDIARKQYQGLDKTFEFDKENNFKKLIEKVKKSTNKDKKQ